MKTSHKKKRIYYILTIDLIFPELSELFKEQLNLALDWAQVMPNVFILESTSDNEKWYTRLKLVLGENKFFLIQIDLNNYTGWLQKWVIDWINSKKKL